MKKTIGKYEVHELLGRGGMAEVFRAYHPRLNRYVAIKVLHDFLADDPEFEQRFANEAQNIARLRHAHIVQVFDFEVDQNSGSYYMVMELVEGVTLKGRMAAMHIEGRHIDTEDALRIVREAASALAYAHRAGMIHRDVKPANLMLDSKDHDRVVLTDFGIAKMLTSSQYTLTGGLIGTPAYMAPEQGSGDIIDERSDLYALGVIFFQMLTGDVPYQAETPLATILQHLNDPIPSAIALNSNLPPSVDMVIHKLLAKEPKERYQTANELIDDITQIETEYHQMRSVDPQSMATTVHEHDTIIFNDSSASIPPSINLPQKKHSRGWLILLTALLIVIVLGGGYIFGASNGTFPAVALLASKTPTPTATMTTSPSSTSTGISIPTETPLPTTTPSAIQPTNTATASTIPTATASPTRIRSATSVDASVAMVITPSNTSPPSPTATNTPNMTATLQTEQTATASACVFDYTITNQTPLDGSAGPLLETDSPFSREITFLNTGTCDWESYTSLVFVSGENFNIGPRIVIQEAVAAGDEVTIRLEGTTPLQGRLENGQVAPIEGIWQLRTRGQLPIGGLFTISVVVFNPGR